MRYRVTLAFTRGRFQGMGYRAWICAIGRTRQDEESSAASRPGDVIMITRQGRNDLNKFRKR